MHLAGCRGALAHLGQGNVRDARRCQDDAEGCVGAAGHATRAWGIGHIVLKLLQCTQAEDSVHRPENCSDGISVWRGDRRKHWLSHMTATCNEQQGVLSSES